MWRWQWVPALPFPQLSALFAQADLRNGIPTWLIAALSGAGAFLVTLMSGKVVVPTFAYQRERERADKWEAEAMRQNGVIADRMIPALLSSSQSLTESTEAVKQAIAAFGRRSA